MRAYLRLLFILAATSFSLFGDTTTFTYQIGDPVPAPNYSTITSMSSFQITGLIVSTTGQAWLQASLSSSTTPATLIIAVNPIGLSVGTYVGAVVVSSPHMSNTIEVDVLLTVTPAPPPLTATPTAITFNAVQGTPLPASQTLQVGTSLPSGTAILWDDLPSSLPAWVTVSSLGLGFTPFSVQVSVASSVNNLAPGTYSTSLHFHTMLTESRATVPITLNLTGPPPVLQTNTSQLTFQYLVGSVLPSTQTIQITSSSKPLTATVSASALWITASPSSGTTPLSVTVGVNPSGLVQGTYTGQVTVAAAPMQNTTSTQTVDVSLTVTPDLRPTISGVMNAASYVLGVGPGSWISVMGTNLAKGIRQVSAPFPMSLDGVSVQLSGVGGAYSMLVYYISPTQINAFAPLEMAPTLFGNSCNVTVTTASGTATYVTQCQALTPALFRYGTKSYVSATHVDYSVVGVIPGTTPATAGSIITLWGTGFGQTTPPTTTSNLNTYETGGTLANSVTIMINNTPVKVLYAGLVAVGLYQFNIQLPDNVDAGDYELTVQVGSMLTDKVILPIR